MLLSFRVANHGSLREPQELNFVPAYEDERPAVTVAAIYGANASGKSTMVDAFEFFGRAVRDSQARWLPGADVPRRPFLLDHASRHERSSYAVDILLDGVRYVYGFAVTDTAVAEEWLYSYPKGRKRVLFERDGTAMTYGATLTGERVAIERTVRPNSLYLSAAAQASHEQLGAVWRALTEGRRVVGDSDRQFFTQAGAVLTWIYQVLDEEGLPVGTDVLTAADLGVHGIRRSPEKSEFGRKLRFRDGRAPQDEVETALMDAASGSLQFVHKVGDEEFLLPAAAESAGTKTWLNLVTMALRAILDGTSLWVDEIDVSLHPLLTAKLLSLFQNPELNPLGAQLVFTTHDASLLGTMLGEQVLRRDQVWFVEKAPKTGASELYPLSDFKPRKGENFERRYLAGSYGAVPLLPETAFEDMVRKYWGAHGKAVPA
ncbi:ATP-binding protein [Streptomyces sp. BPTC-684]|uniref:AAA family ATPase n=1 Tax=Streptomyces sp. BPTC-684 TaxID=3043734 RepID=UPI0024B1539A|nr:ATP-binding protein [Streptomyces sp. BPTC-684]WHM37929.1 ATP-binding protein [Streptomyces sp. BPTC-684]